MNISEIGEKTAREIERCGEGLTLWIDGHPHFCKGVVNDSLQSFTRRHYDERKDLVVPLGFDSETAKIVYMRYESLIDMTDSEIYVDYRGERYIVLADSFVCFGSVPVYTWFVMEKLSKVEEGYYNDL